jgi:uncharacterized phage protein (TIGR02216 family)
MAIGFGLLRLSPHAFWAMTPREFERAASPYMSGPRSRPDRHGLAALMQQFPDDPTEEQ